jgi:hypothetical protein
MGLAFFHQEPLFAIVIALGFNCLLRITEMLNLTHQHVVNGLPRHVICLLEVTSLFSWKLTLLHGPVSGLRDQLHFLPFSLALGAGVLDAQDISQLSALDPENAHYRLNAPCGNV